MVGKSGASYWVYGVKMETRELQSLALIETLHYYILLPLPCISPSSLSVVFASLRSTCMALSSVSSERDSNAVAFRFHLIFEFLLVPAPEQFRFESRSLTVVSLGPG